jgi:hypothetical protein
MQGALPKGQGAWNLFNQDQTAGSAVVVLEGNIVGLGVLGAAAG